jgi:hypothetical protein
MGLPKNTIEFIEKHVAIYPGVTMCELGNQHMRGDIPGCHHKTGKEYWGSQGVFHLSIDLNGKDGAMVLNLAEPLAASMEKPLPEFDIVIDCGVLCFLDETDQKVVFENIHHLCTTGGYMIHILPPLYSKWSAKTYYEQSFFKRLAEVNDYAVLDNIFIEGQHDSLIAVALVKCHFAEIPFKWIN